MTPPTEAESTAPSFSWVWTGAPRSEVLVIVVRASLIVLSLLIVLVSGNAGRLVVPWVLLAGVAVAMTWLGRPLRYAASSALAEALLTVVIATSVQPVGPLLLYWLAPGLAAGLRGGYRWALVSAAVPAGVATLLVIQRQNEFTSASLVSIAQWGLLAAALGLMGSWVATQQVPADPTLRSYGEAVRLLTQLEPLSRRLSEGLDAGTIGLGLLRALAREIDAEQCVLVARDPSGGYKAIAGIPDSRADWVPDGGRLEDLVTVVEGNAAAPHELGPLLALPMRVADQLIGFVLVLHASSIDKEHAERVGQLVSGSAVALQAALLFDSIRFTAANEERDRIAREIHDGIAQDIAFLGYAADELVEMSIDQPVHANALELRKEITRVVGELRRSVFDLRSLSPTQSTLGTALTDSARRMFSDVDVDVHVVIEEDPERLRPTVEAELLRIGHEALTNARKHAGASNVWLECRVAAPDAMIVVEDDGEGIKSRRDDSFGIEIMRERATRIRADLVIRERPGGGTSVLVRL